jgi:hypothetical protein
MQPLPLSLTLIVTVLVSTGCASPPHNGITEPSAVSARLDLGVATGATSLVAFPPRNEPFLFRTNLESKYRDGLHREATRPYVDIEGSIVWTQEYLHYRVNQCGHADAVSRVFQQIDGRGVAPVCGVSTTTAFPPRNEPLDFRTQLELKYRDGLQRSPSATFVDAEGDIVWTLEYLRYRLSSCGHADAESKVFAQIDDRSRIPPDCTVCSGVPGVNSFLGWTTADVPPGSVRVFWEAGGGVATSYVVELGTSRGASNLAIVEVSGASRNHVFSGLAPGDYFIRVRAKNACGAGTPSNDANPRVR